MRENEKIDFSHIFGELLFLDFNHNHVLRSLADTTNSVKTLTYLLDMNRADCWAVDYQNTVNFEVEKFLSNLAQLMEAHVEKLHLCPDELAEFLAYLTTTRSLFLMKFVALKNKEFMPALLKRMEAPESSPKASFVILRARMNALGRAQLLGQIFSDDRLQYIACLMQHYSKVQAR